MGRINITESEKESIKNMYNLKEDSALMDTSIDSFKKLLTMLGNTFKSKDVNKPDPTKKDVYNGPKGVLGSEWKSCKAWRSKGGLSSFSEKVNVDKSSSQFKISYKGPSVLEILAMQ